MDKKLPADVSPSDVIDVLQGGNPYIIYDRDDLIHGMAMMKKDDMASYSRVMGETSWKTIPVSKSDFEDAVDAKFKEIATIGEQKSISDMKNSEKAAYLWEEIKQRGEKSYINMADTDEIFWTEDGLWSEKGHFQVRYDATEIIGRDCGNSVREECVGLIQNEPEIMTDRDDLGINEGKLVIGNVVLDLETKETEPLTPDHLATKRLPHEYNPDVSYRDKEFYRVIKDAVADGSLDVVQQFAGYMLMQNQLPYAKIMIFVGDGANGKSTVTDLFRFMMGEENCIAETPQTLAGDQFSAYQLETAYANINNDIGNAPLGGDDDFLGIASGDPMTVDQKFMDKFDITPKTKHLFACNKLPECGAPEPKAFYRRWIPVEFPNNYPVDSDNTETGLAERIGNDPEEMSAMINWALDGYDSLMRRGSFSDGDWRETRQKWMALGDDLGSFIVEHLNTSNYDGYGTSTDKLYNFYTAYLDMKNSDRKPDERNEGMGKSQFAKELANRIDDKPKKITPRRGANQVRGFANVDIVGFGEKLPELKGEIKATVERVMAAN